MRRSIPNGVVEVSDDAVFGRLRARPLEARPERDAGLIWFVTDVRSGKENVWEPVPQQTRPP